MALQNYVDQVGPVVSAEVLNELDQIRNVVTVPVALNSLTISTDSTINGTLTVSSTTNLVTLNGTGIATFSSLGNGGNTASVVLSSARPQLNLVETDAGANLGRWKIDAQSGVLSMSCLTDAGVASNFLSVARALGVPTSITFPPTLIGTSTFTTAGTQALRLSATTPVIAWDQTGAAANNNYWDIAVSSEQFLFRVGNNAENSFANWCVVDRTANTIDSVTFPAQVVSTLAQTAGPVSSGIYLNSGAPAIGFRESDAAADNRLWDIIANGAQLNFRLSNDAASAANFFNVNRSGNTCTSIIHLTDQHSFRNSSNAERVRFEGAGNCYFPGVGTTASAANAFLNSGSSPANELLRSTSSIRYKTDVQDLSSSDLAKLFDLRPITYRSKCEGDNPDTRHYGLIAEEVADILPSLVHYTMLREFEEVEVEDESGEKRKEKKLKSERVAPEAVQYERLVVLLLAKMKEQQEEIEDLKAQFAQLKVK